MSEVNYQKYSSAQAVKHYSSYSDSLQPPEQTILSILDLKLREMAVLDIGVGGGRTTPFLAGRVRSYLGVDFSPGMIEACQKKWHSKFPDARFEVCDVRDLSRFAAASLDLVLFSFNGLDNIDHQARAGAIEQMNRVLKPGGYLCFSSHNLHYLPRFFSVHFRLHPIKFLKGLLGRKRLLRNNKKQIEEMQTADHVVIFDDVYDLGLETYYIRPNAQKRILESSGFAEIRMFELSEGKELSTAKEVEACDSPWVYYLAIKGT